MQHSGYVYTGASQMETLQTLLEIYLWESSRDALFSRRAEL